MVTIKIPVTEEWNHMFKASEHFPYVKRPFMRSSVGRDDFATLSEPYTRICGEPVWFYSWGNARWLRCPIGRPGDRLNDAGDRIVSVDVRLVRNQWAFIVSVEEAS